MQESGETHVYTYLTQPEVRFLDAVAARLIPADDLGPGGKEAGVSAFIDNQLTSVWGSHGRNYRQGPWPEAALMWPSAPASTNVAPHAAASARARSIAQ